MINSFRFEFGPIDTINASMQCGDLNFNDAPTSVYKVMSITEEDYVYENNKYVPLWDLPEG